MSNQAPPLAAYLNKPEYVFRPWQIVRRFVRAAVPTPRSPIVGLPWGLPLRITPADTLGYAIWTTGAYDLAVSEVLWRLIEPGEQAVDAGANIGYMTSLMARRAGAGGTVWAFEPHPEVFAELSANARLWDASDVAALHLVQAGLSDCAGAATLVEGPDFAGNRGTGRIGASGERGWPVRLVALDDDLGPSVRIGVLKLDVEGHEAAALRGASRLLEAHAIRDVVYEEHSGGSPQAAGLLRSHGYEVFRILKGFLGPILGAPEQPDAGAPWMPPSFLATTDAARAGARLTHRGWDCLRGH